MEADDLTTSTAQPCSRGVAGRRPLQARGGVLAEQPASGLSRAEAASPARAQAAPAVPRQAARRTLSQSDAAS